MPTKAARTSQGSSSPSASAIGSARSQPAASPSVALAIVNQNEVRRTSSLRASSFESNLKRKKALEIPARRIVTSTAESATRRPTAPKSPGSR